MVIETRDTLRSTESTLESLSQEKLKLESSLKEERLTADEIKKENESLKVNLQAKKDAEAKELALAAEKIEQAKAPEPIATVARAAISGDKQSWLAASGIPEAEWGYVDSIVSRESGWDPCAYNPGRSDCNASPTSACGLAQSLPCGKQASFGHWTDPVANLKWQHQYVKDRYGGYAQAVAFWNVNHWY